MRRFTLAAAMVLAALSGPSAWSTDLTVTTTLTQETSNNTSAADSFRAQSNGNAGAGNVSKLPLRNLLYPGSTTRIYAHFMPWFGGSNHMNVGYRSDSAEQVRRQVEDMISRGIAGAIVDWYGPDLKRENDTTLLLMREAELHLGRFEFAVMEDAGALKKCANTSGCDVTQRLILDLNYAASTYYPSPAYMRVSGRPVVFFFGMSAYSIDWNRVRASVQGNPLFIFRNSGGFTHVQTNGSFSWLATQQKATHTPGYMSLGYLDDFYKTGLKYPAMLPYGSGFPGFDDSLAAWGKNRYIGQYCGQTWLQSLARAGLHYSASNQLHSIQLVTWNDYEEGSSIENGIDNCLSVSASLSGTRLNWSLVGEGSESTVDHFNVFISTDGEKLAKLTPLNVNTRSLDLAGFALAPGTYRLYVQAYGKPSIHNKMSGAVTYVVASAPPTASLSVTPESGIAPASVTASTAGSVAHLGSIASSVIDFGDGRVASGTTVAHTYAAAGSYTVRATVSDSLGQSATATHSVTVHAPFVSVYAPADGATLGPEVRVSARAFSGVEVTVMQVWVDGVRLYDGPGDTVDTTLSLAAGTRRITVQGRDRNGLWPRSVVHVTVSEPPTAALSVTPESGIAPAQVTASTAASTAQLGSIVSSVIDFGDGRVASGTTVSHTYSAPGTYAVRATVTDSSGQSASTTRSVRVDAPYVTVYAPADGATVQGAVRVAARAFSGLEIDVMQVWVDGVRLYNGPGDAVDTSLLLASGGRRITVQGRDAGGEWHRAVVNITVNHDPPQAALSVTPESGLAPAQVTASTSASLAFGGNIVSSVIDFGDGRVASGTTVAHTYAAPGTYTVRATVTDSNGLSASATRTVTVTAPYVAVLSPGDGTTVTSAVRVSAQGYSGAPVEVVQIWVDGAKLYDGQGSAVDTTLSLAEGARRITVSARDAAGNWFHAVRNVTVLPDPYVRLDSPGQGATVGSPVRIAGQGFSPAGVRLMQIYVNGKKVYEAAGDRVDVALNVQPGNRRITLQAMDNDGSFFNTTVTVGVR